MVRQRRILRRFDKTPFPSAETDAVCPHFMLLAWANGCPYNCAWCYLKGTFRFYGQKSNGRVPIVFKDRARVKKELVAFLNSKESKPELINTGELSDSLMDETGQVPFSTWIMSLLKGTKHKVLFVTKSTRVQNFLANNWQDNAILSWSINAVPVADRWERLAPSVVDRLDAAKQVYDAGYEVRLRIDPMVSVEDWQRLYAELVDMISARLKPNRVTLGCLRGLNSTILYCRDKSWVQYLTERSNWGKKPPFEQRLAMYRFMIRALREKGIREVGICKDTLAVCKTMRIDPSKIECNCVW
jgi:spore photoproduct lyase